MPEISDKTKVGFGVVVIIVAAAISWGVMYEKVNTIERGLVRLEEKIDQSFTSQIGVR